MIRGSGVKAHASDRVDVGAAFRKIDVGFEKACDAFEQ